MGPIENSYCVEEGKVYAGEFPGSVDGVEAKARMVQFLEFGIDCFIDLTEGIVEPGKMEPYRALLESVSAELGIETEYHNRVIRDAGVPTRADMAITQNLICDKVAEGKRVYIHCWGGVGRTGTTVGCYLAGQGLGGEVALAKTQSLFETCAKAKVKPRVSPENEAQRNFVLDWMT